MQYMLFIYQPDQFDPKSLSKEEHATIAAEYQAVTSTPNVTPGIPLGFAHKAITVRSNKGVPEANEGPYAGAAGAVGGYMLFEADTLEEAVALAGRVPAVRLGGAVEIRPCEVYW
jgi:hypothetical protein